ncbi:hypothetical protein LQF67_12165, partial [Tetragenococcus halophilus]|uniref:hypothetical protein n=1 Tax=Tetragenococcus halophilus TaxID=51669 RepID=UPI001F2B6478
GVKGFSKVDALSDQSPSNMCVNFVKKRVQRGFSVGVDCCFSIQFSKNQINDPKAIVDGA